MAVQILQTIQKKKTLRELLLIFILISRFFPKPMTAVVNREDRRGGMRGGGLITYVLQSPFHNSCCYCYCRVTQPLGSLGPLTTYHIQCLLRPIISIKLTKLFFVVKPVYTEVKFTFYLSFHNTNNLL